MINENVFSRQSGLVTLEQLKTPILIIGAGTVGSWTALALTKLGCSNVSIMDGDFIEEHNAGSQLYKASDENESKVETLARKINFLTEMPISFIGEHWNYEKKEHIEEIEKYPIIISAVDSIITRENIFNIVKNHDTQFIDCRMAGDAIEIYTCNMNLNEEKEAYEKTIFPESETRPIACSERSVVYNAFVCSGFIADLVAKYVTGNKLPLEIIIDLRNYLLLTN